MIIYKRKLKTLQGLYFGQVINCNEKKTVQENDIGGIGLVRTSKFDMLCHMLLPKVVRNGSKSGSEPMCGETALKHDTLQPAG